MCNCGLQAMRPIQITRPLQARCRHFHEHFPNFRVTFAQPPIHFHGKISRRISVRVQEVSIREFRSIAPLRKWTIARRRNASHASEMALERSDACIEIDGKPAAHSVVILPNQTQRVGQGGGAPRQIELGRLKARGRPGNRAAHSQRADILQLHARAHRPSLQVQLPAARAVLFHAARNVFQARRDSCHPPA